MGPHLINDDSKESCAKKVLHLGLQVKFSPIHTIDKSIVNFFDHETTVERDPGA